MPRRTKIVVTLGPATDDLKLLREMIEAGVNVARLNMSHGSYADHQNRVELLRKAESDSRIPVALLVDLQGPKIRIEKFRDGKIELDTSAEFVLDAQCAANDGDQHRVGIAYKDLPGDVEPGDELVLDDGRIELQVVSVSVTEIRCKVLLGGTLSNNKGINLRGGGLSAPALTDKDKKDIRFAAEIEADYVAVSFPRTAEDIIEARLLLQKSRSTAGIVAKIERTEAVKNIVAILKVSDSIMIARGDLGVELGDAELPAVQKTLIDQARGANRMVITATQMMESMINCPVPTRAEVFDVANAVLDGTDAVMLSAETATGKYPVKVVEAMHRICAKAETHRKAMVSYHRLDSRFERTDEAIAMAAMYTANHSDVRAIAALTESGATCLWMSRISSGIPIYALTRHLRTRRRVTLYRGVTPVEYEDGGLEHDAATQGAVDVLVERGLVKPGDRIILTLGDIMGVDGGTNGMKIITVSSAKQARNKNKTPGNNKN